MIDYSHEVQLARSPLVRWALVILSCISLVAGIVGIFLPVLPTTPFVLFSAFCYARSSTRFYNLINNDRRFGPPLRRWKERGAISFRHKIVAILAIATSVGSSVLWFIPLFAIKVLVGFGATVLCVFIGTRPSN